MVNSTYALRETTSKANSLKNRGGDSTSSIYSSDYFYTAKDPQYHQFGSPEKMTKSAKKTKASNRKPKKQSKKSKTKAKSKAVSAPPSMLYDSSHRIRTPNANDVLCGRGGNINNHPGNIAFRSLVSEQKNAYNLSTNKNQKSIISQSIVDQIHSLVPSGRFLTKDETMYGGGWWVEVDNAKAVSKTSQALREGAPTIRALAAADNKSELKGTKGAGSTKAAKRSLGKRKRASYKRSASAKVEKEASREEDDQEQEEASLHPLIVPMSNGHRGKQLIPRSSIEQEEKQELEQHHHQQQQQEEAEGQPQKTQGQDDNVIANPCVSFDEDHDHEPGISHIGNVSKKLKLKDTILDTKAETPPPLEIPTPSDTSHDAPGTGTSTNTSTNIRPHLPPFLDIEPKIIPCPQAQQLPRPPSSTFFRAHSLLSSETNGLNEGFRGDENFVNPFLNESAVLADFYKEQEQEQEQSIHVNDWNTTQIASQTTFQSEEKSGDAKGNTNTFDFAHNDSNGSN